MSLSANLKLRLSASLFFMIFFLKTNHVNAQLNFFTRNIYFANENIKKASVSKDGEVFVLKANNEVALIQKDGTVKDLTALCRAVSTAPFNDIVGVKNSLAFIATQGDYLLRYDKGVVTKVDASSGVLSQNINSVGYDNRFIHVDLSQGRIILGSDIGLGYSDTTFRKFFVQRIVDQVYGSPIAKTVVRGATPRNVHYDFDFLNYYTTACEDGKSFVTTTYITIYGSQYPTNTPQINTALSVERHWLSWEGPKAYWGTNRGLYKRKWVCRFTQHTLDSFLIGTKVNKVAELNSFMSFYNSYDPNSGAISVLAGTDKGLYFSNNIRKYTADTFRVAKNYEHLKINNIEIQYRYADEFTTSCDEYIWLSTDKGLYKLSYRWDRSEYPDLSNLIQAQEGASFFFRDTIRTCSGTKLKFSTTDIIDGVYQWQKDEIDIPGANSSIYETDQPGKYRVIIGTQCEGQIDVTKEFVVIQEQKPQITFNHPDKIKACAGEKIKLQTVNNSNYTYTWFKDNNVLSGRVANEEEFNEDGEYKVMVSNCKSGFVESKTVFLEFLPIPQPALKSDKNSYCEKEVAKLTATITTGNKIKWYQDGKLLNHNGTELLTRANGRYYITEENEIGCIERTQEIAVNFQPLPSLSINPSGTYYLCFGETGELKAETNAANIKWSTGESVQKIKVTKPGKYLVTVSDNNNCNVVESVDVIFHNKIVINLDQDMSICEYKDIPVLLYAPKGFLHYYWNDKPGTDVLPVTKAGLYTLKVEDQNGCSAMASVNVKKEYCKELNVPNVFTPNGDGINDLWMIPDTEILTSVKVCVFDRYGSLIYQCENTYKPWDGTFKNKVLPPGTYYYTITSPSLENPIAGAISIMK